MYSSQVIENQSWYEKSGSGWCLWAQRVSLSITPGITIIACFAAVFQGVLNTASSSHTQDVIFLILMFYGMPVPAAVAVIAWIKPYAGGIAALISVPLIAWYITLMVLVFHNVPIERPGIGIELFVISVVQGLLLLAGGIFGVIWKHKQKKTKSF
jgi:hypothetical protein